MVTSRGAANDRNQKRWAYFPLARYNIGTRLRVDMHTTCHARLSYTSTGSDARCRRSRKPSRFVWQTRSWPSAASLRRFATPTQAQVRGVGGKGVEAGGMGSSATVTPPPRCRRRCPRPTRRGPPHRRYVGAAPGPGLSIWALGATVCFGAWCAARMSARLHVYTFYTPRGAN